MMDRGLADEQHAIIDLAGTEQNGGGSGYTAPARHKSNRRKFGQAKLGIILTSKHT